MIGRVSLHMARLEYFVGEDEVAVIGEVELHEAMLPLGARLREGQ